jgi:hypothetical protein
MSTHENGPGGIHAKRIEADNVVSGVVLQKSERDAACVQSHIPIQLR